MRTFRNWMVRDGHDPAARQLRSVIEERRRRGDGPDNLLDTLYDLDDLFAWLVGCVESRPLVTSSDRIRIRRRATAYARRRDAIPGDVEGRLLAFLERLRPPGPACWSGCGPTAGWPWRRSGTGWSRKARSRSPISCAPPSGSGGAGAARRWTATDPATCQRTTGTLPDCWTTWTTVTTPRSCRRGRPLRPAGELRRKPSAGHIGGPHPHRAAGDGLRQTTQRHHRRGAGGRRDVQAHEGTGAAAGGAGPHKR